MTVGDGKTASAGSAGSGNGKKNAMPAHETRRRVKLYALNAEKQWDDKGTGHVSSSYVERLKGYSLLVRAEVDGSILLESKILPDTTYQKQQETLIVWSEGENYDLALSFQERAGCDEIWEKICQVQGKDPSVDTTQDVVDESEDERFSEDNDVGSSAENTFNLGVVELPAPEISKLEEIDEVIQSSLSAPVRREKLALVLESDEYLRKLMGIFRQCEDIEDIASLQHLYRIVRNIFLMNKTTLIELLLQDDVVFDVIGCLEYDPAQKNNRRKHRQFLQSQANFRQVVPTTNKELNAKIHQTYRAQYLHDVALPAPSFFEDNTSTLSSFIFFNKVDIVSMIQKDEHFLNEVFSSLTDENTEPSKRRDLVFFLKELCTFSQTLQPANREGFMKSLSSMGILSALEIALCIENQPSVRNAAVDILHLVVEFSPSMIREHMLQQVGNVEEEQLLSNVLLDAMMCDSDPDLTGAMQLQGIFKIILDPENMLAATNKSEKSDFLTYFYKHSMHVLTAPLLAHTADGKPAKDDYQSATLLSLIVEVLAFCVDHHTFHVKNYIIGKDLLRRVLVLLKSAHRSLALCALRLMRKILNLKDTFYNTHIMEKGLFEPVINCLIDNNRRYNLLDSAILEMFEFVKGEVPTLYAHIVDRYGKRLEAIDYVPTFRDISKKKKQAENDERSPARGPRDPRFESKNINRFRRDPREPEEDETLWFDTEDDDDEDPTPSTGPNSASLLASVATPVVSSFLPVSLGAANGGSPSLTSLSPTATSPIPSLVSSPLAALTSSAIGSVVSGLGPVSPLLSAAAAASSAFANLAAGSALSAVAELTEQGLVKGSLLAKRGLVDYEGDSDEEENERDDGDADCEDEDEDEEDKNAANSSVLDITVTPTTVTMMVNGHEEKESKVKEQPEEAKKAEDSEERLKGEEKEEANPTEEPNKVEEKPCSPPPDKTEQEEPDSPEPHAPSPRKRSREMAMESGGDSESSSPKNGEPEINLDVIDGESRDGLPAEIVEQEESVESDAKRPRVE